MSAPVTTEELATLIPDSTASVCERLEKATLFSAAMAELFDYMLNGSGMSNQFAYDLCAEACETTTTTSTSSTTTTSTTSTTTTTGFGCVYTPNLVPTITNNTTPEGECSAGQNDAFAFRAFDGNDTTFWNYSSFSSGTPYCGYEFVTPRFISKFRIKAQMVGVQSWGVTIRGSNDGASWADLGSFANASNGQTVDTTLTLFNNLDYYTHYSAVFSGSPTVPPSSVVEARLYALELFACEETTTTTTSTSTTTTTTAP